MATKADDDAGALWVPVRGAVALEGGVTFTLGDLVIERVAAPPHAPPGSGSDYALAHGELDGAHVELGLGDAGAGWARDLRVTLLDADPRPPGRARLRFDRLGEPSGPARTLRLKRREVTRLAPGVDVELLGHGHKSTGPGQESPLLVHLRYVEGGRASEESSSLFPPQIAAWEWHAFRFTLGAYEYDELMDVTIATRPLHAVKAALVGAPR